MSLPWEPSLQLGSCRASWWVGIWTRLGTSLCRRKETSREHATFWKYCCCCCGCSVSKSCPTLCDPMDCSSPGFPVHHQFLELAQTHVHRVDDAIQPSQRLLSPSPPACDLSQRWGISPWTGSSHQMTKVLELQLEDQAEGSLSFQWIFRVDSSRIDWFDLLAVQETLKSLLQHHSSRHQFFDAQFSLSSNSHICMWPLEKS